MPFCATPLRLDSSNNCQFGCAYCFARTRQGFGRGNKLRSANVDSLERRLKRVFAGKINSALDEFIEKRIPFQLGGMSDPFSKIEKKQESTLKFIRVLNQFDYPFIVSTKSALISSKKYLAELAGANAYVRFSTTVVSKRQRKHIDKGCPSIAELASAAEQLANIDIPVAFRFQPILPGHEQEGFELIDVASSAGVRHISSEYLKVPIDANLKFGKNLKALMRNEPVSYYISLGAKRYGREYNLPLSYKAKHLAAFFNHARDAGMSFGFGDNELLIHSDGNSCCNAADIYLRNASFFDTNIVGLAKKTKVGGKIHFKDFLSCWIPKGSVSTYLNSTSRLHTECIGEAEWLTYLRKIWLGKHGVYSPSYFDGISSSKNLDSSGLPVFKRESTEFSRSIGKP